MSLPTSRQALSFLNPLKSRTTVFMIDDRETNLLFSRFLLGCCANTSLPGRIADIDAFYSSNAVLVTPQSDFLQNNFIISLPPSSRFVEDWAFDFLIQASDTAVIILDDLNSLYHLMSFDGARHTSNRMGFLMALASFFARSRHQTIISKAYARDRQISIKRGARSLDRLGDLGISVASKSDLLTFECVKGKAWEDGIFSVRISP